jgi:hypothetical protein
MAQRLGRPRGALLTVAAGVIAVALVAAAVVFKPAGGAEAAPATAGMHMKPANAAYWREVGGGAFHGDGKTRTYYIGADHVVWDYAPKGMNEITGKPFDRVDDTYVRSGRAGSARGT